MSHSCCLGCAASGQGVATGPLDATAGYADGISKVMFWAIFSSQKMRSDFLVASSTPHRLHNNNFGVFYYYCSSVPSLLSGSTVWVSKHVPEGEFWRSLIFAFNLVIHRVDLSIIQTLVKKKTFLTFVEGD